MKKEKTLKVTPLNLTTVKVRIEGDSDLILNKMNRRTKEELLAKQRGESKKIAEKNDWEDVITAMRWRDGEPTDFTEEGLAKALKENAPCITAFGLKKSFMATVVRTGIDKYSTKFNSSVKVLGEGSDGLIPITYAQYNLDEKLIPAKLGSPVRSLQSRFSGWSAEFTVQFIEGGEYSLEQIVQIIGLAGFGGGIGSGRNDDYGRYHVAEVRG